MTFDPLIKAKLHEFHALYEDINEKPGMKYEDIVNACKHYATSRMNDYNQKKGQISQGQEVRHFDPLVKNKRV